MSAQFNFEAIGTAWTIDIYQNLSEKEKSNILNLIQSRIELFDKAYSRFREDSIVTEISKSSGLYTMPEDFNLMIETCKKLYDLSGGLFTPLIGQVLVDAGYDEKYSLKQNKILETPPIWEEVIEYKKPNLTIKKPALLDFGALGKGYLIDIIAELLEENGFDSYCVEAGGDMIYKGSESLKVGFENPNNTEQVIGVVNLKNESICGSSGNRRKWGNFHHIINPKSLTSPLEILSVWVIAESAIIADALSTCLFFISPDEFNKVYNFEYLILRADFSIEKSAHFPGEIFSKKDQYAGA